ncbi:flagellar biosynthesis/type III secretory pathway M-ring protein FliF/YscJ [Paenibacillus shirakamiensis]|uniref:Flagellar biosynthesis/type III secretory pathway M-ring protein FliF/YscJ n=1 Tax=Paenibacillus shirakamiensis TaxID=1265935 RepID=A0ABS4JH96_9BACL|nr:flagellar biosynthesis/type III secretory pathway M-ring protein FliF/YscJ [Paenibacillus shirakamiensis]
MLTFMVSFANNMLLTSFIRGLMAFAVWFVLAFAIRWVFKMISEPQLSADRIDDYNRGTRLDYTTPDETDELSDLIKPKPDVSQQPNQFSPLSPPKLVTTSQRDPEELAKAVRHLTEK